MVGGACGRGRLGCVLGSQRTLLTFEPDAASGNGVPEATGRKLEPESSSRKRLDRPKVGKVKRIR